MPTMPNNEDLRIMLQQIFDSVENMRSDLNTNFIRRPEHNDVKKRVDNLELNNKESFGRWAAGLSIISMGATVVLALHALHVF